MVPDPLNTPRSTPVVEDFGVSGTCEVSTVMAVELRKRLDRFAAETGRTRSGAIRYAILHLLRAWEGSA